MAHAQHMKNHTVPAYPSQMKAWELAAAQIVKSKSWWARQSLNAAVSGRLRVKFTERQYDRGCVTPVEVLGKFQFRASQKEIDAWSSAAADEGLELAEWERQVLETAHRAKDLRFLLGAA